MIGHYLLALTPEQEDQILLTAIGGKHGRNEPNRPGETPCLVQAANTGRYMILGWWPLVVRRAAPDWHSGINHYVPYRYDALCERFGDARINNAIRSRILANRVCRTLQQRALVSV